MNKIQNIQQYLRLNFPLLWNVKIFPTLLFALLLNLFFFGLGYLSNALDFEQTYGYGSLWLLYFFSVVTGILSFIIWIVFYSRNNSIKRFYPIKSSGLFFEWLLCFLIIGSFALYPFSVEQGGKARVKSYLTEKEAIYGAEVLNMVSILIPVQKYQYDKNNSYAEPEGQLYSLLDYNSQEFNLSTRYDLKIKGCEEVKEWLVKGDAQQIRGLMNKFFALEKKHGLHSNISTAEWFNIIYNPPTYTICQFEQIRKSPEYYGSNTGHYYVNFDNLSSSYSKILDAHLENENSSYFLLVSLYFSLGLSVLVFSFRVSSGKSWLIALVILGVISLLWGFFAAVTSTSSGIVHLLVWICLFAYLLFDLNIRVSDRRNKGRFSMLINIFIWYLPSIFLFIYGIIMSIAYESYDWNDTSSLYLTMKANFVAFMWINILLTIGTMWFVSKFVRKWKSLPDE